MHTVPILYERHLTIPIESMYNDNKCRLLIMRCKLLEWYYILWNQSGKSCLPFIGDVWAKKYKIRVRYFVNLKKVLLNWMSSSIPSSCVRLNCSALMQLRLIWSLALLCLQACGLLLLSYIWREFKQDTRLYYLFFYSST